MSAQIGIDTGGTHTDVVLLDPDRKLFRTCKVPTTPQDLSVGILDGIAKILDEAQLTHRDVSRFLYGTTYVTNLIVEQQNVEVGLIATEGFRDVLEIGRASRKPNIYDIDWRPNPPVVARRNRLAVKERIDARGSIVTPLDEASVIEALRRLDAAGIASVAVCLLHSYVNPVHERAIARIAAERFPRMMISLSSEIVREFREYERSSTTAINAYVMRPMQSHLDGLAGALAARGVDAQPFIMRGNGGIMSFALGKRFPVAITHSVAGIVGASMLAKAAGFADVITFDMGGTSSDISLVLGGEPAVTTRGTLASYPILLPVIDLVTIGAGGGSIAQVDAGGAVRVGPRSAGSVPGPMCYGQGGVQPTVTDANLVTGRLNADYFLAGARKIHLPLAEQGIAERIAQPLAITTEAAALGILSIAEAHMVNAIKLVSVERGLDPRDFTLVGFGGAGPLHVASLADALGIRSVLVPPAPGNTSASGLLCAEPRQDLVRTVVRRLDELPAGLIDEIVDDLARDAAGLLRGEGVEAAQQTHVLSADLRYAGQSHELGIPFARDDARSAFAPLVGRFRERHRALYGYDLSDRPVELVNIRVSSYGPKRALPWPERPLHAGGAPSPSGRRAVLFRAGDGREAWPVYRFDSLEPGARIDGPAIVEYPGSTLVVPPGWGARCDRWRNLILAKP